MNWKLTFLLAASFLVCGMFFLGVASEAQNNESGVQNNKEVWTSETVQNQEAFVARNAPQSEKNVTVTRSEIAPTATFSYTGPAVAIPDNVPAGVNITLPVSGSGSITDLNFTFDTGGACDATVGNTNAAIDHTFVGDLTFRLTAPNGTTTATFMAQRGGTTENICATTIDDQSAGPNVSTIPSATGTFVSGTYKPETTGPLSVFNGINADGNWTLNVSDNAAIDTGSMRRFSLVITAGAAVPTLAVNDVTVTEGNSGTTPATFTVSLSPAAAVPVSVNYATADQTATAPSDYTATTGTVTFAVGETSKTFTVPVIGDTTFEPNETFAVNLTAPTGGAAIGDAQGIGTINNDDASTLPACVFNNGGLNPQSTSESGVAAPSGKFWSEVQHDAGNTTVSNTVGGFSGASGASRLADNFTVPAGGCQLSTVTFFAYQTGFAPGTSPFTASTLRIWNGRPGDAGATVVFGDTTTNRLASSVDSNLFRIFNTVVPAPGTAPGTTRILWRNTLNVGAALATPGTYWLDWDSTASNAGSNFYPSLTIQGSRGRPTDNGRQLTVSTGVWADTADTGNPATTPSVIQDFPFYLNSLTPAVPAQHVVDFNGDGRTDFTVVRNTGGGAGGQVTWFLQLTGTTTVFASQWGLATDIFVPEDYDGDNRTDLAVWRGQADASSSSPRFYILQSATNTVRIDNFGLTGDDPTVVGDYDGDNKADVAVYRPGAAVGQPSTWFYRGSLNNPAGNITYVPWGQNGDFPAPGDYDGDGRNDFVIQRNNGGGQAAFWTLLATGASGGVIPFGTPTDVIVPGDYDGDGRTDLAVVRGVGGNINWYVRPSSTGVVSGGPTAIFGASATDLPTQGDYDGDGRTDFAIWRPSATPGASTFFVQGSTSGVFGFPFGANGDYPVANYNAH